VESERHRSKSRWFWVPLMSEGDLKKKLTIGVRSNLVVVFMPDGTYLSKPIANGMTDEEAINLTLELLAGNIPPEEQN
jgi:hypothetical protein